MFKTVHENHEAYKSGWVAGFYDSVADDGAVYLQEVRRCRDTDDWRRSVWLAGYECGWRMRRGAALPQPGQGSNGGMAA